VRTPTISTWLEGNDDDGHGRGSDGPAYGIQCWLGNVDKWGQSGLEMVRRFFAAGDGLDTVALLTAGKKPRRTVNLGEGASTISEATRQSLQGS
jgi:hypothetical protein